jgi:hypothetical protein
LVRAIYVVTLIYFEYTKNSLAGHCQQ